MLNNFIIIQYFTKKKNDTYLIKFYYIKILAKGTIAMSANTSTPAVQALEQRLAEKKQQLAYLRERMRKIPVHRQSNIATRKPSSETALQPYCSQCDNAGALALDVALDVEAAVNGKRALRPVRSQCEHAGALALYTRHYRVQNPYGWDSTTWVVFEDDPYEFLRRHIFENENNPVNLGEKIGFRVAKNQEGNGRNTSQVATGIDDKMKAKGSPPKGYVRVVVILVSEKAPLIYGKKLIKIDFEVSLGDAYTFEEKIEIHNSNLMKEQQKAKALAAIKANHSKVMAVQEALVEAKKAQKEFAEMLAAQRVLTKAFAAQKACKPQGVGHVASVNPRRVELTSAVTVFESSDDESSDDESSDGRQ